MRPPTPRRIEQPVPINHPVSRVGQEGNLGLAAVGLPGNPVHHLLEVIPAVNRDREDLGGFPLGRGQKVSQLAELTGAVGSPVAPVEHQDHVLAAPELG